MLYESYDIILNLIPDVFRPRNCTNGSTLFSRRARSMQNGRCLKFWDTLYGMGSYNELPLGNCTWEIVRVCCFPHRVTTLKCLFAGRTPKIPAGGDGDDVHKLYYFSTATGEAVNCTGRQWLWWIQHISQGGQAPAMGSLGFGKELG